MNSSTAALILSLIVNIAQYAEAFYKDKNARKIQEDQLANAKAEKDAQRKHELEKIKLNENIYRSHQIVPEARKLCLEYIGATETEIASQFSFPVNFSKEQQLLETKIILYIPEVQQVIEDFRQYNLPGSDMQPKDLEQIFRNNVIPAIANQLESFQPETKWSP